MNTERLLTHYEQIADTPDAIGRLRRFILDLAVRGKLVQQDPKDEPASELLTRIAIEKDRLVKLGEIRKQDPFEPDLSADRTFTVPESWKWVPATYPAYVVSDMDKKIQTKDVLEAGDFPVVDQGKVFIRGYCNDASKVIRVKEPLILFGDHTRETKLIDFDFVVGADGVKLLQPVCLFTNYYFLALQWLPLDSRGYGRHFKLLRASFLPLPPLAEQHRIVAKVDELMALCDQLEASLTDTAASRRRLLDALLAEALEPTENLEVEVAA
jgi:type I restriction enzyme S subunit